MTPASATGAAARGSGAATVARPRLLRELAHGDASVICLVAGAGYGKTVLARQWRSVDSRPFAWLELHRADNDPVVLMRELVDALDELTDLSEVASAARGPAPNFADRVLPLLGHALRSSGSPFVLVVDDVEVLDAEAAELLGEVLTLLPDGAQAVLLGRTLHPALRTARREAEGSAIRLGPEALAFTLEEADDFLTLGTGRSDAGTTAEILERTTGWPLGLHLAMLAARRGAAPTETAPAPDDSELLLRRYVDEELLAPLDDDDRTFLVESSVLEWLSGDLCDRVLGRSDSARRLERLLGGGHVLFSAGDRALGARYHPLLRAVLLAHLGGAPPDREQTLRRRAIDAYEDLDQHRAAIATALDGPDGDLASEVLFRHLPTIIFGGETVSLARWLAAFSPEHRHRSGLLALAEAWSAFLTNRRDDLESWLSLAEGLGAEGPLPDGSASFEIAIASLRMLPGLDGALASSRDAELVRQAGPGSSPWWGMAGGIETITRIHTGLEVDPVSALQQAEFESRGSHASHATTCSHLGYELLEAGDADVGLAAVRDAVREVTDAELVDFPLTGMVFCTSAYAEARYGCPDRARAAAEHARAILDRLSDVVDRAQVHGHLLVGDAELALGNTEQAARDLCSARDRLRTQPDVVVLGEWADSLERRLRSASDPLAPQISSAELRVLRQLPTHRSLAEIGEQLYVSRNTVKTHTVAIYRKLGVSSRSDAVRVAKELELL